VLAWGWGHTHHWGELSQKQVPPMHSPNELTSRPSSFGAAQEGEQATLGWGGGHCQGEWAEEWTTLMPEVPREIKNPCKE